MGSSIEMTIAKDGDQVHRIRMRAPRGVEIDAEAVQALADWMKEKIEPDRYRVVSPPAG